MASSVPIMGRGEERTSLTPPVDCDEVDPLVDPLILEAVREVDLTLLDWALGLSPRERLRASTRAEAALRKFVRASPGDR
jgi:hypothetical protein